MTTHVLVIDDEEDYRTIIGEVLRGAGLEASLAANGEEGLLMMKERRPDIVLVDWMMPRLDGEQVCRAMRADPDLRELPVLMLTVKQATDEELEALHFGADDFLAKPFDNKELLARIRAALRRAETRHA